VSQNPPLSIEEHPAVGRGFEKTDPVIFRHAPVFGPLDHLKGPETDEDQQESYSQEGQEVLVPSFEVFHFLGVEFHNGLSLAFDRRPSFCYQDNRTLFEEWKKEGGDQSGNDGLGKQVNNNGTVKVMERKGVQAGDKKKDDPSFHKGKDEDEKKLERESLPVEVASEELCHKENEGPREGVEAERVSRKEIQNKAQSESDESPEDRWVGKTQKENQDQNDVGLNVVNREGGQQRGLKGQQEESRQEGIEKSFHFFFGLPAGAFFAFFSFSWG
jgi:hypothetical protein